jgi:transglutaminase-like putative cysteine protease
MILSVEHTLNYSYSNPVSLSPHTIYLTPKASPNQEITSFQLEIEPTPNILYKNIDVEGNAQTVAFFDKPTNKLSFRANFEIISQEVNPFHFIYYPFGAETLPFKYPDKELVLLQSYLTDEGITTLIDQFARQIASEANWKTTDFLTKISKYIRNNFFYEKRLEGAANSPETTFISKKGTCRDYAVLMIAVCNWAAKVSQILRD